MNENEMSYRGLKLKWVISSFFATWGEPQTITEYLHPVYFQDDNPDEPFWSMAERMIDIRQLLSRAGMFDRRDNQAAADEYQELEFGVFQVVSKIGDWSCRLSKLYKELHKLVSAKRSLIDYWEEYGSVISDGQNESEGPADVEQLLEAADELEALEKGSWSTTGQYKYLMSLAEKFVISKDTKEAIDFARSAHKFFTNQLRIPPKSEYWKVSEQVRKILGKPKSENPQLSDDLFGELELDVQSVANDFCYHLNSVNGQNSSRIWVKEMLGHVDKAIDKLGITKNPADSEYQKLFKKFQSNGDKCVALLRISEDPWNPCNFKNYLAFSGYSDCQDNDAIELLKLKERKYADKVVDDLKFICQYLESKINHQIEPVFFTAKIVDKIKRYELDRNFRFQQEGPMRKELAYLEMNKEDKSLRSGIKREFSCCERKILAHIDQPACTDLYASLYVKFKPCINCYAALTLWQEENGVQQMCVDYPGLL